MNMGSRSAWLTATIALIPWTALAGGYQPIWESPRALGRGNTFVAAFYSDESTRMNPAVLAEAPRTDIEFRWGQVDAFVSQNAIDTIGDLAGSSSAMGLAGILSAVEDKFGDRFYARAQMFPVAFRWGQFELTPFISSFAQGEIRLPSTPEFHVLGDFYAGANASFGLNYGKFKVGMTFRPFTRAYFGGDVGALDLIDLGTSESASAEDYFTAGAGAGFGVDVGGLYTPTADLRFGLLIRDVGDSTYGDGDSLPPNVHQQVLVGAAWRQKVFNSWRLDLSADIHDVLNRYGQTFTKLLKMGGELGKPWFGPDNDVGVSAGLNDGYMSIGGFIDLWLGRFEVTNYAIEAGAYPGQRMDRRWGMGFRTSTTF